MTIKGYIASSADGYIASIDGSVDFLTPYQQIDCGYEQFIQGIDIVVMGRKTYEVICELGDEWPYPQQQGVIVSSNPNLALVHPSLSVWDQDLFQLVEHLKQKQDQNVWIVGGTQLQNFFLENNLLDVLEVYEMPVMLGDGISLFPKRDCQTYALKSLHAEMIAHTVIKKTYHFK